MATFIQALKNRYAGIGGGLPVIGDQCWVGVMPEGTAETLPMGVMTHEGEAPRYDSDDVPYGIVGRVRFWIYEASLESVEALCGILWAGMENGRITIGTDVRVRLERGEVRYGAAPFRGPAGQFVYQGITPYEAFFQP
jgi:hypothetical protein